MGSKDLTQVTKFAREVTLLARLYFFHFNERISHAPFDNTYIKIGTMQRLTWSLNKDAMQIHEAFHSYKRKNKEYPKLAQWCMPGTSALGWLKQEDHLGPKV